MGDKETPPSDSPILYLVLSWNLQNEGEEDRSQQVH